MERTENHPVASTATRVTARYRGAIFQMSRFLLTIEILESVTDAVHRLDIGTTRAKLSSKRTYMDIHCAARYGSVITLKGIRDLMPRENPPRSLGETV
jgi:hypothetical protein